MPDDDLSRWRNARCNLHRAVAGPANSKMQARLAIVLHAHLPYVRHPEHPRSLEERWLFEAILECYLPLLDAMRNLERDRVPFALTMTITPPLACMLQDPLLMRRFELHLARLERLADAEMRRCYGDAQFAPIASFYRERLKALGDLWRSIEGDILKALRAHWDQGSLDVIACSATHAYLPGLLPVAPALTAQVELGMLAIERALGRRPRGMWLPECAYHPSFDSVLRDARVEYTVMDSHAIEPRGQAVLPRVESPGGTLFYGRDPHASEQVWARQAGYPGDAYYRDFYRDIGFDNPESELLGELGPFGTRVMTGLKYHRITGNTADKAPYQPGIARERIREHAADFVAKRRAYASAGAGPGRELIVAPYDAELFGHWWFEGPWFIEEVFRALHAQPEQAIEAVTLAQDKDSEPLAILRAPRASSWGEGGFGEVWVGSKSAWLWRHVHHASRYVLWALEQFGNTEGSHALALDQMIRELLLLQSSDWAFILHTETSTGYAHARVRAHTHRLRHLGHLVAKPEHSRADLARIEDLCVRDRFLPNLTSQELRAAFHD
jgi:1,4-alpha-glucan branching enzyme